MSSSRGWDGYFRESDFRRDWNRGAERVTTTAGQWSRPSPVLRLPRLPAAPGRRYDTESHQRQRSGFQGLRRLSP